MAAALATVTAFPRGAAGAREDEVIKKVRLDQKMNAQVPLNLTFRDETGKAVQLHEYFRGKPVMLNLIQYRCTMLCSQEMNVLAASLQEMTFDVGKQFTVITLSIDARESPDLASAYREGYLKAYDRPGAEAGWHFLTGDEASIQRLADAIGFHFTYDARTDQFAHPDGVIILTPEGRISHYFFRLLYPPRDMRLALVEAADRKIGSPLDAFALLCYHYNPVSGRFNLAVMGVLRVAALATLLLLGGTVALLSLRERLGKRRVPA
jgi:protein SCO1/2